MKIKREIGKNPYIDWIIVIFLCLVVAIILATWGFSLYNAVTKGDIQGTPNKGSDITKTFDTKAITSVINKFSDKEEASGKAKVGYDGPVDPSI